MHARPSVLIIDDDPMHLRIYGWIVEAAGYHAITAQVQYRGVDLPTVPVDLVLLDYNLAGLATSVDVASRIKSELPSAPIIVLSDAWSLPDDIAPMVQGFARKGDPAALVEKLRKLLASPPEIPPEVVSRSGQ